MVNINSVYILYKTIKCTKYTRGGGPFFDISSELLYLYFLMI